MATENQMNFIMNLIAAREVPEDIQNVELNSLTSYQASALIDRLKAAPMKSKELAHQGYYRVDGRFYTVCKGKTGGTYAKMLVRHGQRGSWEYVKGMVYHLKPENRVTLDEARTFGKLHGFCLICGRTLTDPKSVEAGIGPVCATRV